MEQLSKITQRKVKQQTCFQDISSLLEDIYPDLPLQALIEDKERYRARMAGAAVAVRISDYWNDSKSKDHGPIALIDMFSGCGGMSTGFMAANGLGSIFSIRGAVDIDPVANESYYINHRVKPLCDDMSKFLHTPKKLDAFLNMTGFELGGANILIGCAPCQGFSSHRNDRGGKDPRNPLFVDFACIGAEISPDVVVVENVPELFTDQYWPYVQKARQILEKAGYYVYTDIHNMAEFGVPQERFRALMLAMKRPFKAPKGFLSRTDFLTVRKAIGSLPPVSAGQRHTDDLLHFSAGHKQSTIDTIRAVPKDGGNRPDNVGPECLKRAKQRNGKAAYEDVYGRLAWDKPAITITAYARNPASGRFVHPEQDRGLTVRETALLQSFPREYEITGGLDERFRQIGNAVPPSFSAFLAMHIVGELIGKPLPSNKFDMGIITPVGSSFSRMIPSLKNKKKQESLIDAIYT